MNESQGIHRDIYVGMVAEEMAESGYYGEDVTRYGFLANGELHSFANEDDCAETYLLALAAGAQVSRLANGHKHCAKKQAAKEAAAQALDEEMQTMLSAESVVFVRKPVDLTPLAAYTKALEKPRTREQDAAIVGIMTLPTFAMKPEEREAVLDVKKSFDTPQENRRFFGFFEKRDGQWQKTLNGALSAILIKWLAAAERGHVSPILPMHLDSQRPVYVLRDDFEQILQTTMNDDYLAMLDALYASQH